MTEVSDLLSYLDAAPSPYHAVAETSRRLDDAGFERLEPTSTWPGDSGHYYTARGGALTAWIVPPDATPHQAFHLVGAHTDSPGLRIKPIADASSAGWQQLAVEVYGGALWNSWLDRDLGLSGRVVVRTPHGNEERLVRDDHPLLRIPQLAIHLDRDVNGSGLKLNPQQHLTPVWGLGSTERGAFVGHLADALGASPDDVVSWDVMVHDVTPASLVGRHRDFVSSARLDNLLSCWAATEALVASTQAPAPAADAPVAVVSLFDHEEVGSTSATGADGASLAHVLERIVIARGGGRDDYLRSLAGSACISADGAHATHPNYPDRHDADHPVTVDGGPVIKVNANQRYATEASTAALVIDACERAGVPHQRFVGRNDQPCGSTIGPATAAQLGVSTVDVGVAQLAMHSARELCGATDPVRLVAMLGEFLRSP